MDQSPNQPITFQQYRSGSWMTQEGHTIVEKPVSLTVNGENWLTFRCTPVDLEALALGFLYNEGIIETKEQVAQVRVCASQANVDVWLYKSVQKPERWQRTSGCTGGLTRLEAEDHPASSMRVFRNGATLTPKQISGLISSLLDEQELYRQSGGVHTSALSDGERLVVIAEDIGRHNTLDKIAGRILLEEVRLPRRVLLTTGRISSEMMQKSARLDAPIVISRTSPSSMSIQMADSWGMTLVGYARRDRFNVYTHPHRILLPATLPDRNSAR